MTAFDLKDTAKYDEFANASTDTLRQQGATSDYCCIAQVYDEIARRPWGLCPIHGRPEGLLNTERGARLAERAARSRFLFELSERGRADIEQGRLSTLEDVKRRLGDV